MVQTRAIIARVGWAGTLVTCALLLTSCADTRAAILMKVGSKPGDVEIKPDIVIRPGLFVAQNKDGFEWENVVVNLSDGRNSTEYVMRERLIAPMDSIRAEPWRFRRFAGRGPNPIASPALIVTITCDTPRGHGVWSGHVSSPKLSGRRSAHS